MHEWNNEAKISLQYQMFGYFPYYMMRKQYNFLKDIIN